MLWFSTVLRTDGQCVCTGGLRRYVVLCTSAADISDKLSKVDLSNGHRRRNARSNVWMSNEVLAFPVEESECVLNGLDRPYEEAQAQAVVRKSIVGTFGYMAPEVIMIGVGMSTIYTEAVDWYALGALMYKLLTGICLHGASGISTVGKFREAVRIGYCDTPRDAPIEYLSVFASVCGDVIYDWKAPMAGFLLNPMTIDLISKLTHLDPTLRLCSGEPRRAVRWQAPETLSPAVPGQHNSESIPDIAELMTHPFFAGISWEKLERRAQSPPYHPATQGELVQCAPQTPASASYHRPDHHNSCSSSLNSLSPISSGMLCRSSASAFSPPLATAPSHTQPLSLHQQPQQPPQQPQAAAHPSVPPEQDVVRVRARRPQMGAEICFPMLDLLVEAGKSDWVLAELAQSLRTARTGTPLSVHQQSLFKEWAYSGEDIYLHSCSDP